jgi:hypothetical protein
MAFPTTLALITALWSGPARTKSIALWSGVGGAISAMGPLAAGWVLLHHYWGAVFLLTLPLAAIALLMALWLVPGHVNETAEPVDNVGGVLSIAMIGALILAINFAPTPGKTALVASLAVVAVAVGAAFVLRQLRTGNPLFDLGVARRRVFWVATCAGINVLDYSTFEAGLAILPSPVMMVVTAPISARLVATRGSRFTLLCGYGACLLGFLTMLIFWKDGISYLPVGVGYAFIGMGIGIAGTPASNALTGSVPVKRAGMASGTADLQRDLGGAIMQSILGALLTAGYASNFGRLISGAPSGTRQLVTDDVAAQLQKSFAGAAEIAKQDPQYAKPIILAARESFLYGADWAYLAGAIAIACGAALVYFVFPKHDVERDLLAQYHAEDSPTSRSRV